MNASHSDACYSYDGFLGGILVPVLMVWLKHSIDGFSYVHYAFKHSIIFCNLKVTIVFIVTSSIESIIQSATDKIIHHSC